MNKELYINADDIGLSRGVTDTILQIADQSRIDGVSVITNGEALSYTLAELARRPGLKVALHANLTEGKSLTTVPLLTTPEGFFTYSPLMLWLRFLFALPNTRRQLRKQVRKELFAQHAALGGYTERIDGHQHVHTVPFIFDELVTIPGIRRVRIAREPLYLVSRNFGIFLRRALPVFGLSLLAMRNRRIALAHDIEANEYCIGVVYSGSLSHENISAGFAHLPREGSVEIVVHPGSATAGELQEWQAAGADISWHTSPARKRERELLTAPDFKTALLGRGSARWRVTRFIISGTAAAAVHLAVFASLLSLQVYYGWAIVGAFIVSFMVSFSLQKWWTFRNRSGSTHHQMVAYLGLQLGNLLANEAVTYILVEFVGILPLIAQFVVLVVLAISTFFLSSLLFARQSPQT